MGKTLSEVVAKWRAKNMKVFPKPKKLQKKKEWLKFKTILRDNGAKRISEMVVTVITMTDTQLDVPAKLLHPDCLWSYLKVDCEQRTLASKATTSEDRIERYRNRN